MEKLISDIEQDTANTAFMTGIKQIRKQVLDAIRSVDRTKFVKASDKKYAYRDHPLDIGYGQTISQPFVVALITHLIEPKFFDKVLEVGSGSGYQVAVLSKLCEHVFGIEVIKELAEKSQGTLKKEHIENVTIICADGNFGLKQHAPFQKIIVSAAANNFPKALFEQLAVDGIMVLPKNISPFEQMLVRVQKTSSSEFKMTDILPVRFVPLVNS